jgi:hypothetical protein
MFNLGLLRKTNPRVCMLLAMLLLGSLLVSITGGENVLSTGFFDDFEGTEVNPEKWVVQENTNMSGNPAYGGSVKVAESKISLSSNGSSFPWVQTATNPFPETGDFVVEFDFTYTCVADWGNGFCIGDTLQRDGRPTLFSIWAGDTGPDEVAIYITLLGNRVYQITVPGWKPSTDKHFYRLEYVKGVYTVYVDGILVASAPSERRPIRMGFGHAPRSDIPPTEEYVETWGYWGWCSFEIDAIKVLAKDPAKLSMQVSTSTTQIGCIVDVNGTLTSPEGTPLQNETVLLSYSVSEPLNWQPISAVTTDANGVYSSSWIAPATGKFVLKAEWVGNEMYSGAYAVKNINVSRGDSESLFFAESNSTLSALAFNSTSKEISFTVSGPSGTTGYTRFLISKELMENFTDFVVYLDGQPVEFTATSEGNFQSLYFEYTHSTHQVTIKPPDYHVPEFQSWIAVSLLMAVTSFAVLFFRKKSATKPKTNPLSTC